MATLSTGNQLCTYPCRAYKVAAASTNSSSLHSLLQQRQQRPHSLLRSGYFPQRVNVQRWRGTAIIARAEDKPNDSSSSSSSLSPPITREKEQGLYEVTAEDESGIHIWDLRMPKLPIRELPGHAHWTWAVQHNPEYHELILSGGTDSTVNLWFASASSKDDTMPESLVESPTRRVDPLLNSYNDYEDSVYGLAWSSREPWIFASLSYDGRVVVESVKPYLPKK